MYTLFPLLHNFPPTSLTPLPPPLFWHMSRRVQTLDSDEPGEDEPIEEQWFKGKGGRRKIRKKQKPAKTAAGFPEPAANQEPTVPEAYPGDPTEQEVIENVRQLPDIRSKGKVKIFPVIGRKNQINTITQSQNDFLREWVPRRSLYLTTLLSKDAPRDPVLKCQSCGHKAGKWRCTTCVGGRMLCGLCCRDAHQFLPFHRVEAWNGRYFATGALWQVGLKLCLGHQGARCPWATVTREYTEESHR